MKTKKQVIQEMIDGTQENIYSFEVMERFFNQKEILSIGSKDTTRLALGKVQKDLKEKRDFLAFLNNIIKEY
ncbi:MAG: hypothetical protein IPM48_14535 [Saprospiraceae bacterium]|nr:hypothetical protein [Saprospiraceae bacterium]